ncbi:helix-turn-helix domain-containing protein [Maridesulfovibrio sp.]|uniref:helix-turn-helix domain-containing protein n=1 Tax=Maridesulfovibrio sp. TaxID=2795000 RepID=UPI003BA86103
MNDMETLSVTEAAENLKVHQSYIRGKIHSGEIKAHNVGSEIQPLYRIRIVDLDAFLESRSVEVLEGNEGSEQHTRHNN